MEAEEVLANWSDIEEESDSEVSENEESEDDSTEESEDMNDTRREMFGDRLQVSVVNHFYTKMKSKGNAR
jgi:hypothetical protein